MRRLILLGGIIALLALSALGLIDLSGLKRSLAGTTVAGLAHEASTFASAAYDKLAPMATLEYWKGFTRNRIRDLKESASRTPAAPQVRVVVIRHRPQVAAVEPPSPPVAPSNIAVIPTKPPLPAPVRPPELPQMAPGFEGCWQTTITKPDTWRFLGGPEVDGWSPATYQLCFHRMGSATMATFSADSALHLTSQWVVPSVGERQGHTDIVFQNNNFVLLHASGILPMELKVLGFLPGPKPSVSYDYYFHCYLRGQKLMVEASMTERCGDSTVEDCHGQPWVRQSWHHELSRVGP